MKKKTNKRVNSNKGYTLERGGKDGVGWLRRILFSSEHLSVCYTAGTWARASVRGKVPAMNDESFEQSAALSLQEATLCTPFRLVLALRNCMNEATARRGSPPNRRSSAGEACAPGGARDEAHLEPQACRAARSHWREAQRLSTDFENRRLERSN
jgi:hypothetical protein